MALILSRKRGESVVCYTSDGPITCMVDRIRPGRDGGQPVVWLAWKVPLSVTVLRGELVKERRETA